MWTGRGAVVGGVVALLLLTLAGIGIVHLATPRSRPTVAASTAPAVKPYILAARAVDAALAEQDAAVVAGSRSRWLALVDPAATQLVAAYAQRFQTLQSLGVHEWHSSQVFDPRPADGPDLWRTTISVHFCLGADSCAAAIGVSGADPAETLTFALTWRVRARAALLETETAVRGHTLLLTAADPWLLTPLSFAAGSRVIVAAPDSLRDKLSEAVQAADLAAANADLIRPGRHPGRFVIYLAGPAEWSTWFGGGQPRWAGAYTHPVAVGEAAVVVNLTATVHLGPTLQHELGHVVTVGSELQAAPFWLTEGVADYFEYWNTPVASYPKLADVRTYLRAHPRADLAAMEPDETTSDAAVAAYYGFGYLAVRYLMDTYGRERTFAFVDDVQRGIDVTDAATIRLSTNWTVIDKAILSYVRRAAGL